MLIPTKQIKDDNFGSYTNISPATSALNDTLDSIDAALAGGASVWSRDAGPTPKELSPTTVGDVVLFSAGTVAAPGWGFVGEKNTGIYKGAAGRINFSRLGVIQSYLDSGTFHLYDAGGTLYSGLETKVDSGTRPILNLKNEFNGTQEFYLGNTTYPTRQVNLTAIGYIAGGVTNSVASNFLISSTLGTGNAAESDIVFRTSEKQGTGTTLHTYRNHTFLDGSNGKLSIYDYPTSTVYGSISSYLGSGTRAILNFESNNNVNPQEFWFGNRSFSQLDVHINAIGNVVDGPTNQTVGDLLVGSPLGTGTGAASSIYLRTPVVQASGATLHTYRNHTIFNGVNGKMSVCNFATPTVLGSISTYNVSGRAILNFESNNNIDPQEFWFGNLAFSQRNVHINAIGNVVVGPSNQAVGDLFIGCPLGSGTGAASSTFFRTPVVQASGTALHTYRNAFEIRGTTGELVHYGYPASTASVSQTIQFSATRPIFQWKCNFNGPQEYWFGNEAYINQDIHIAGISSIVSGATNATSNDLFIDGPRGTGNNTTSGNIFFQTAVPGASGTTLQALSVKMTLFKAGQLKLLSSGSETLPAFAIGNETDTGAYSPAANQIGFTVSGAGFMNMVRAGAVDTMFLGRGGSATILPNDVFIEGNGWTGTSTSTNMDGSDVNFRAGNGTGIGTPGIFNFLMFLNTGSGSALQTTSQVSMRLAHSGVSGDIQLYIGPPVSKPTSLVGAALIMQKLTTEPTGISTTAGAIYFNSAGTALKVILPNGTVGTVTIT